MLCNMIKHCYLFMLLKILNIIYFFTNIFKKLLITSEGAAEKSSADPSTQYIK